jgi:hypothetical protein
VNYPFLTGDYLLTCKANNIYVPTQFEIEEYCKNKRHTICPFFKFKDHLKKEKYTADSNISNN